MKLVERGEWYNRYQQVRTYNVYVLLGVHDSYIISSRLMIVVSTVTVLTVIELMIHCRKVTRPEGYWDNYIPDYPMRSDCNYSCT